MWTIRTLLTRMSRATRMQLPLFLVDQANASFDSVSNQGAKDCSPCGPSRLSQLKLCVLGSGSGGNSAVVCQGASALVIDLGLGPMTTARRLVAAGMNLQAIRAVCLTHLDQDHFRPTWVATLLRSQIPIYLHRWHIHDLASHAEGKRLQKAGLVHLIDEEPFEPVDGYSVQAIRLPHDTKGTCGYRVVTSGGALGYATDLGYVPKQLIDAFTGVDLLAIESNYDEKMQVQSGRPAFLKRRIMGRAGHLSNDQSFIAVREILDRGLASSLQHIVLLHRSNQCNHPSIVRHVFEEDPRLLGRITLAEQREITPWICVDPNGSGHHEQLNLKF